MIVLNAARTQISRSHATFLSKRNLGTTLRSCTVHAGRRGPKSTRRRRDVPEKQAEDPGVDALPLEVHGLWERFLGPNGDSIQQVHARIFYDNLDHGHILGWASHRAKKPPCYSEYVKVKKQYPDKLIAMQIGDFFEFAGWDTVMVIEALGLRGMGLGAVSQDAGAPPQQSQAPARGKGSSSPFPDKVPRAGFPLRTGKVDIARLCHAGHDVAVALQRRPEHEGAPVTRYVAQICTPHSPYCELAAAGSGLPTTAEEDRPVWGLQQSTQHPGTWTVHIWLRGALVRRSVVARGQQEVVELLDASRGRAEWLALPVYFQSAGALREVVSGALAGGAGAQRELQENETKLKMQLQRRFRSAPRIVQSIRVLDPDDFVETVQSEHLAPAPVSADGVRGTPHVWRASHETADQPLFLHESTSRALGMVAGDVPDLVDSVLGTGQLKGQRQKVRGLVMRPPPPDVAADISTAIRQMMTIDVMPEFAMLRGSNAIWSRMQAGRARTADLRAVLHSVTAATHALNLPAAGPLMHALLRVATWTLGGCTCDTPAALLERCRWVVRRLEPLLPAVVDEFGAEVSNEDAEADRVRKELQEHGLDVEELPVNVDAVVFFFRSWEEKKVKEMVQVQALPSADAWVQQLGEARRGVIAVIAALVQEATRVHELTVEEDAGAAAAQMRKSNARNRILRIVPVEGTQSLALAGKWLQEVQGARKAAAEGGGGGAAAEFMRTAALRTARQPGTRREYTCDALIEALEAYRETVAAMHDLATQLVQEASIELHSSDRHMETLQAAQQVNEWGSTLCKIAINSLSEGWSLPDLAGPDGELSIEGVWPYWMQRPVNPGLHPSGSSRDSIPDDPEPLVDDLSSDIPGGSTVTNDVYLGQRIMLLTGANMSGKSTLMRSVMAVALLGNLGLPVPCKSATVPQYKSFFYRCFDGDSPLAGLSGHAYECFQMQQLYDLATPFAAGEAKHFMCVDELGKGTEDLSASALCCAALELFDSSNFVGVFGTHQHDLFEERLGLLPKLPRSFCCHMHVAPGPLPEDSSLRGLPWLRRTFRLAPGVSTDSLAFQVAYEEGLPPSLLQEANRILQLL